MRPYVPSDRFGPGRGCASYAARAARLHAAACWVAITPNGRYAYTANVSSSSVSSHHIDHPGALSLLAAKAAVMPAGNDALDMATTPDGRQLHVFASRAPQQIDSYRIGGDGGLTPLGAEVGITAGSAGLAAN